MSLVVIGLALTCAAWCRPIDVLSVPAPAGALASSALHNQTGAESAFNGAKGQLFSAADGPSSTGLLTWSGLLTDEFTFSGFTYFASYANVDARMTTFHGGFAELGDFAWEDLLQARATLLL